MQKLETMKGMSWIRELVFVCHFLFYPFLHCLHQDKSLLYNQALCMLFVSCLFARNRIIQKKMLGHFNIAQLANSKGHYTTLFHSVCVL